MSRLVQEVYALEAIPYTRKKVFLAGPSPRDAEAESWRPKAVDLFEHYANRMPIPPTSLLLPEGRDVKFHGNYEHQTEWEHLAIESCDVLMFWVPRDIENRMPGFTTNVEFGYWIDKKPVVLGYPEGADKMTYLKWLYEKKTNRTPLPTLEACVNNVAPLLG